MVFVNAVFGETVSCNAINTRICGYTKTYTLAVVFAQPLELRCALARNADEAAFVVAVIHKVTAC